MNFDTPTHRENSDAEKYGFREKLFGTRDVYPMWVADMEFKTAPAIQVSLTQRVEHGVFGYAMPDEALYAIAQQWIERKHRVVVDSKNIEASPSIVTSMAATIEAFSKVGEGVTVLTPIYPPFLEVVSSQERVLHTVSLLNACKFLIDFEALEAAFKQSKIFLLCNPHNPVGRVWTQQELEEIARLALKHQVIIVSDDAHADIVRKEYTYTHITTALLEVKDRVVTLMGPGKGFNISGLGATLLYSHDAGLMQKVRKVLHTRHVVPGSVMSFNALKAAYTQSEDWLEAVNRYIDTNMHYAQTFIQSKCAPLRVHESEGTYLLWIDCTALGLKDKALKSFFVEQCKLGLSLGRSFGDEGRGFVRMNCAVPFENLKEALHQIQNALQRKT